jgi:hypothetical protein
VFRCLLTLLLFLLHSNGFFLFCENFFHSFISALLDELSATFLKSFCNICVQWKWKMGSCCLGLTKNESSEWASILCVRKSLCESESEAATPHVTCWKKCAITKEGNKDFCFKISRYLNAEPSFLLVRNVAFVECRGLYRRCNTRKVGRLPIKGFRTKISYLGNNYRKNWAKSTRLLRISCILLKYLVKTQMRNSLSISTNLKICT